METSQLFLYTWPPLFSLAGDPASKREQKILIYLATSIDNTPALNTIGTTQIDE